MRKIGNAINVSEVDGSCHFPLLPGGRFRPCKEVGSVIIGIIVKGVLFLGPKGAAVSYSSNITKGKQKAGNEQHVSIDNYFLFVHAGYYGESSRAGISEPSAWPHAWTRVTWSWLFGLKSVVTSSCKQL
jgi:hypothetical protein